MSKKLKLILIILVVAIMSISLLACGPEDVDVTGVTLNESQITLEMGETKQLTATVTPSDANQDVVWESTDAEVATVDKNGLVTAISDSPGGVHIIAKSVADKTKFAECEVVVALVQFTVNFIVDGATFNSQTVRRGENAIIPVNDPIKRGFEFKGWFTAATGGTKVTSVTNVTANTSLYAQFEEAAGPIERTFLYEAEHINLFGIMGDGASGGESQRNMIVSERYASGSEVISYLYNQVTLTFIVWSDIATTSKLFINLGTENATMEQSDGSEATDSEVLIVSVNNTPIRYESFWVPSNLNGEAQFVENDFGTINLIAGVNYITLTTKPANNPGLVVDYMKFRTTAILQWHELTKVVDPGTAGYPNLPIVA